VTYATLNRDKSSLANEITGVLLGNYATVAALARQYGFEYYFFWPPHISKGKKILTSEEEVLKRAQAAGLQEFLGAVYEQMETRMNPANPEYSHFFSLVDVFDDDKTLVWLDHAHTTPDGNERIAQRMLQVIDRRSDSNFQP
jgi:hypothetical protein